MGHARKAPAGPEDAAVGGRPHVPGLRHEDGRHAERAQPHHEQHGRHGLQLARRHARAASRACLRPLAQADHLDADHFFPLLQETLDLRHPAHTKTDEVAITALDFPDNETTTFWVGTEEGNVYQANRYDRAGAKAGLNQHNIYRGHAGPVTGLHFHPLVGPIDFSDLFLTSSVDWTIKLWRSKAGAGNAAAKAASLVTAGQPAVNVPPLCSFEENTDYVYDVRWHPVNPAVFGSVDGTGRFDMWNLNADTEVRAPSSTGVAPPAVHAR